MRTNVIIDDELMAQAMKHTGLKSKRIVIEEALRTLIRLKSQEQVRSLRGMLHWEGNLGEMRQERLAGDAFKHI
jgi:Arc/MetJ family transcription regulator